jgi:hypothetical protein
MALAAAADARSRVEIRQPTGPQVIVCLQNTDGVLLPVLALARSTATRIFATIDVQLKWCEGSEPPAGTNAAAVILARIDRDVPEGFHPGALAYAMPLQSAGTRIHIFADRLPRLGERRSNGVLLGNVLAHEIAHVLEGVSAHSTSGVMKAQWNPFDIEQMMFFQSAFAEEDVLLIRTGLERSAARLRSVGPDLARMPQ